MSALFEATTIVVTNEGFDDETGLLGYAFTDDRREPLATATESKRRNRWSTRLAPPLEPGPFRFDLMVRAPDGSPLLRIEKRQRFPRHTWVRVTDPAGRPIGYLTGLLAPLHAWDFKVQDARRKTLAHIENDNRGKGRSADQRSTSYSCRRQGSDIAHLTLTRDWETKIRGTRDFFHRYGNEYTLEVSDTTGGALRMLLAAFPVIADVSRDVIPSWSRT
jgi:hypothetical protein